MLSRESLSGPSEAVGNSIDRTETSLANGAKSLNVIVLSSPAEVTRSTAFCCGGGEGGISTGRAANIGCE